MNKIYLTKGFVALVDDSDYPALSQYKWHTYQCKNTCYAVRTIHVNGKRHSLRMHHAILGKPSSGLMIDHKDGNGLNNTRANLRVVTRQQNDWNRGFTWNTPKKTKTSKFKGVSLKEGKWRAQIFFKGKIHLGTFNTAEEAAKIYDVAACYYFGSFARLNFPQQVAA